MFTIADFKEVEAELVKEKIYSVEKNELSYRINLLNSTDRGLFGEKMLVKKLMMSGFVVQHYGSSSDFDILVDSKIKVEVKMSSIKIRGNRAYYYFQKIKPELCDVVFFMFLTPTGVKIKWTHSDMIDLWAEENNAKRGKEGYTPIFDGYCDHMNMYYYDNFDSFVEKYGSCGKLLKRKTQV